MRKAYLAFMVIFLTMFFHVKDGISSISAIDNIKNIKIVVDFNVSAPDMILLRLGLLEKTLTDIENAKKSFDVVVAIRGGAVDYMTKTDKYIKSEYSEAKSKVKKMILILKKMGVRFELCSIAAGLRGVDLSDILDEIQVVKNGYLSIVGYQNKGYAFLPMD
jgi:intracellular sulfur oxidation DsrE/DsrF family protein